MASATQSRIALLAAVLAGSLAACEEPPKETPKAKPSVAPPPSAAPAATASAKPKPLEPRDDCPEGSAGPGTFDHPCKAEGDARVMEVSWNGKIADKGPTFKVINKSDKVIIYGSIAVYFYDQAGKQLEVEGEEKSRPNQICSGKIFAGVVNPDEKIFVNFSCVRKRHVPSAAAAIEAEIVTAGFADSEGKRSEFYWQNKDLAPDERPKGGIKPDKKK